MFQEELGNLVFPFPVPAMDSVTASAIGTARNNCSGCWLVQLETVEECFLLKLPVTQSCTDDARLLTPSYIAGSNAAAEDKSDYYW